MEISRQKFVMAWGGRKAVHYDLKWAGKLGGFSLSMKERETKESVI